MKKLLIALCLALFVCNSVSAIDMDELQTQQFYDMKIGERLNFNINWKAGIVNVHRIYGGWIVCNDIGINAGWIVFIPYDDFSKEYKEYKNEKK